MSKVIVHSPGMVSVDASDIKTDSTAIDFLKTTNLYNTFVKLLGGEQAARIIEHEALDHLTEADTE